MIRLAYHPDDYSGWAREVLHMSGSGGDDLAGLHPTDWERAQLDEVLAELDEEDLAVLEGGEDSELAAPADRWSLVDLSTPGGIELAEEADDLVSESYSIEAARLAEDEDDRQSRATRRPSWEARVSRALHRLEFGEYLPPPLLRDGQARGADGQFHVTCSEPDDFGRCSGRFHDLHCHVNTEAAASTGNAREAEAWRDSLTSHPTSAEVVAAVRGARAAQLANPVAPQHRDWDDLLSPEPDPQLEDRMLQLMAGDGQPPPRERLPMPPVGDLARELGLRR
jgi:hypothetical protein